MAADQLESLGFLRRCGCHIAARLDRYASGLDRPAPGTLFRNESPFAGADIGLAFSRVAKAVRQIVVLEQETAGVRDMPVRRAASARAAADAPADIALADVSLADTQPVDAARSERLEPAALRDPPDAHDLHDRDDTDDYDDYAELRSGTLEQAVARIRADLAAMPGFALAKIDLAPRVTESVSTSPDRPEIANDPRPDSVDVPAARPKHGLDPPE